MAEQEKHPVGVVSTLAEFRNAVNAIIEPITRDGTLAAFGRQGADELWAALRASPDTIHAEEPGTILNPTQGEIAASRKLNFLPPAKSPETNSPTDRSRVRITITAGSGENQSPDSPGDAGARAWAIRRRHLTGWTGGVLIFAASAWRV